MDVESAGEEKERSSAAVGTNADGSVDPKPFIEHSYLKKKKRRRKRRRGHLAAMQERQNSLEFSPSCSAEGSRLCSSSKDKAIPRVVSSRGPVLRPFGAQVPRAPNNSTQFIMDDHENSSLFVDFHEAKETMSNVKQGETSQENEYSTDGGDWYPFSVADFESAYQSAREDRLTNKSKSDLCSSIVALEEKVANLSELLAASPSRILDRLQIQLLHLQEENANLKSLIVKRRASPKSSDGSSSSSSSSSDSDSDSSQTSSECSDSSCDDCAQKRSRLREEEKENACPKEETLSSS